MKGKLTGVAVFGTGMLIIASIVGGEAIIANKILGITVSSTVVPMTTLAKVGGCVAIGTALGAASMELITSGVDTVMK